MPFDFAHRFKKFIEEDAEPNPLLPYLDAGNGTQVDIEISTVSEILTVRWNDTLEFHRVTYSLPTGYVMVHNSSPIYSEDE